MHITFNCIQTYSRSRHTEVVNTEMVIVSQPNDVKRETSRQNMIAKLYMLYRYTKSRTIILAVETSVHDVEVLR